MLPLEHPDRIQIAFDDHRLVNNAGLLLPATLAQHVGLRELVDRHLDLGDAPGRANAGDKMLTLVASALAGGDCIDAADALRAGRTSSVLGCMVKAPSTPRFRGGAGKKDMGYRTGIGPAPRIRGIPPAHVQDPTHTGPRACGDTLPGRYRPSVVGAYPSGLRRSLGVLIGEGKSNSVFSPRSLNCSSRTSA